jgi:hypothetical protein
MLAWIAARCLDTSRQRPSAIEAMIFSNLIAQSGSGCLAHRNQPRVRQAARQGRASCAHTLNALRGRVVQLNPVLSANFVFFRVCLYNACY